MPKAIDSSSHGTDSSKIWNNMAIFFPTRRPVTFCCFNENGQTSHTEFLSGTGQLRNTTGCYITSDDVQTFSELHGTSQTSIEPTKLYLSEKILIMADYEVQQLQEIPPL
jgi:hypothetical protein